MSQYPPLAEAHKGLKISWYKANVDRAELRKLTKKSNTRGLVQALGHLILYLATGYFTFRFWESQSWLAFAVLLWCHGAVATFFHGAATHELMHNTVFRSKWLNTLFLNLFSLLGWWNYRDYQLSHKYHHFYTLYMEADRENSMPIDPVPDFFTLLQMLTVNLFVPAGKTFGSGGFFANLFLFITLASGRKLKENAPTKEWLNALHDNDPDGYKKVRSWASVLIVFHTLVVAAGIVTGLWVLPIIITLAPYIANIASFLVGVVQHSGMNTNDPDFRRVARSMKLGPVLHFLYWRMNWHCEHHMYGAVPCYNLRKLSKLIRDDMPEPLTLWGAWKEMLEIRKKQKQDPAYEHYRPLPSTANPYLER